MTWWPRKHDGLVADMIEHYGSEELAKEVLLHTALDSIATSRRLCPPSGSTPAAEAPDIRSIIQDSIGSHGLTVGRMFVGRPSLVELSATELPVVVGDGSTSCRIVPTQPVTAKLCVLTKRTGGAAVFSVALSDDYKYELIMFMLRSEGRVLMATRAHVQQSYDELAEGKLNCQFSKGANRRIRFSLPKTSTRLDLQSALSTD